MSFISGMVVGVVIMFLLHWYVFSSYKRILVLKSIDGTAERINKKFYYIKEERQESE